MRGTKACWDVTPLPGSIAGHKLKRTRAACRDNVGERAKHVGNQVALCPETIRSAIL